MNKEVLDYLNANLINATIVKLEDGPGQCIIIKLKLLPEKSKNTITFTLSAQLKLVSNDGELHIEPQLMIRLIPYPLK